MNHLEGVSDRMIANNASAAFPTHPGEIVKDEIIFRGISQRQLAKQIGVSNSLLNEVLNGKRALNAELALMLEASLGVSADSLMAIQTRYNMQMVKRNPSFLEKLKAVAQKAALV